MPSAIDLSKINGYAKALREGRSILLRELAKGYAEIARYDIATLRQGLAGKLNVRAAGLANSFKGRGTDPDRADDFSKLFATEYTGWTAAGIFQTGGPIAGRDKRLTILLPGGRDASGRRLYSSAQLQQLVAAGRIRFVPTPRGVLMVLRQGASKAKGLGTRETPIALLRKSVTESKRLDFFENAERNDSVHEQVLSAAVDRTLERLAAAGQ